VDDPSAEVFLHSRFWALCSVEAAHPSTSAVPLRTGLKCDASRGDRDRTVCCPPCRATEGVAGRGESGRVDPIGFPGPPGGEEAGEERGAAPRGHKRIGGHFWGGSGRTTAVVLQGVERRQPNYHSSSCSFHSEGPRGPIARLAEPIHLALTVQGAMGSFGSSTRSWSGRPERWMEPLLQHLADVEPLLTEQGANWSTGLEIRSRP
jgi:hypothetical protein